MSIAGDSADSCQKEISLWEFLREESHEWDCSSDSRVDRRSSIEYLGARGIDYLFDVGWQVGCSEAIGSINNFERDLRTKCVVLYSLNEVMAQEFNNFVAIVSWCKPHGASNLNLLDNYIASLA